MIIKESNENKCVINSELVIASILNTLKSPSNWVILVLTYMIWSLVGMRYSSNQNFNMVTAQQDYVMYLSLVSIIVALVNQETKLIKLALIGSITFATSFVTVAITKVGIIVMGYPVGYYFFCPITLFLSLLQLKQISYFACCKYYGAIKECSSTTQKDK